MSHVVSIRLKDDQFDRLKRFARRAGKTQSEMGAQFIEETMREAEFGFIEFRNNAVGREAYMKGSRVQVLSGPFVGREGTVQELDGKGFAKVLLGLLATRVRLTDLVAAGGKKARALSTSHRKPTLGS